MKKNVGEGKGERKQAGKRKKGLWQRQKRRAKKAKKKKEKKKVWAKEIFFFLKNIHTSLVINCSLTGFNRLPATKLNTLPSTLQFEIV